MTDEEERMNKEKQREKDAAFHEKWAGKAQGTDIDLTTSGAFNHKGQAIDPQEYLRAIIDMVHEIAGIR